MPLQIIAKRGYCSKDFYLHPTPYLVMAFFLRQLGSIHLVTQKCTNCFLYEASRIFYLETAINIAISLPYLLMSYPSNCSKMYIKLFNTVSFMKIPCYLLLLSISRLSLTLPYLFQVSEGPLLLHLHNNGNAPHCGLQQMPCFIHGMVAIRI